MELELFSIKEHDPIPPALLFRSGLSPDISKGFSDSVALSKISIPMRLRFHALQGTSQPKHACLHVVWVDDFNTNAVAFPCSPRHIPAKACSSTVVWDSYFAYPTAPTAAPLRRTWRLTPHCRGPIFLRTQFCNPATCDGSMCHQGLSPKS